MKRARELKQLAEGVEGVELHGMEVTRKGHYKLRLESKAWGVVQNYIAAFSPSDHRGRKNLEAALRRFAKTGKFH